MDMHQSHPDILKRLRRAAGHLTSVITMIEAEKPCLDIAQQLHAVEAAIAAAKRTLIHDHIDHCIGHAPREERAAVDDIKRIAKFL